MKVVELVMAQRAHGWSPAELHFQYPHISMSQVYAALAYYWDHQAELDANIERRSRYVEQVRRSAGGEEASCFEELPLSGSISIYMDENASLCDTTSSVFLSRSQPPLRRAGTSRNRRRAPPDAPPRRG